ncbi:MAG: hypothetical protein V4568_11285 [Pseudomonadota bacterium]
MKTFDELQIHRPQLARSYLQFLEAQPGRPLALFAPRRVGKTFFLDYDVTPTAKKAGLIPVYADLWLHRAAPLDAINHALEEALDDIKVPRSNIGKVAKTPVKKIGGLSVSVELGDEPQRRKLPETPELRFDALITRLAGEADKPVLLMLDEVQVLGDLPNGQAAIATLRAVLQKRKREVRGIFTGSSQEALAAMMVAAGGPMYQFAQLIDFPVLGEEYLELLAEHFSNVQRGKHLDLKELAKVFEHIGFKPELMKDIVKTMSAEGMADVQLTLKKFMKDNRQISGWRAVINGLATNRSRFTGPYSRREAPYG